VNRVTPELFRRYPDPETLAEASSPDIEQIIRTLGLFRAKAKSLKECARRLVEEFAGEVPATMEELTRLAVWGEKPPMLFWAMPSIHPGSLLILTVSGSPNAWVLPGNKIRQRSSGT
jgi:endonuclease III